MYTAQQVKNQYICQWNFSLFELTALSHVTTWCNTGHQTSDTQKWRKWFYILSNAAMQCIGQTIIEDIASRHSPHGLNHAVINSNRISQNDKQTKLTNKDTSQEPLHKLTLLNVCHRGRRAFNAVISRHRRHSCSSVRPVKQYVVKMMFHFSPYTETARSSRLSSCSVNFTTFTGFRLAAAAAAAAEEDAAVEDAAVDACIVSSTPPGPD